MTLIDQIDQDVKKALKARETHKLSVLRGLKSDLKYRQIEASDDLTEEQVIEVLSSARKKRQESIEQFERGGRQDLAEKEKFELSIIASYLPQQLSEAELRPLIQAAIEESGVDSPQKIGLVMKVLMPRIKGRADGKLVNRLVAEILAN